MDDLNILAQPTWAGNDCSGLCSPWLGSVVPVEVPSFLTTTMLWPEVGGTGALGEGWLVQTLRWDVRMTSGSPQ
jgi:hypothetical protein